MRNGGAETPPFLTNNTMEGEVAKINISGLPKTRQEAINIGGDHYFTGIPCLRSHIDCRTTINRKCLACARENQKKRYRENRKSKKFMKDCAKRSLAKRRIGGKNAKIERRKYILEYRAKNKEKIQKYVREYGKAWRENNRKREMKKERERYHSDINHKIRVCLRARLRAAIKFKCKKGSAIDLLGMSIPEFIEYFKTLFQPGMSWNNHGEWHIDHKIALTKFNLEDPKQLAKACHWCNLQPLWASDNISKGNKIP